MGPPLFEWLAKAAERTTNHHRSTRAIGLCCFDTI
jgi:hypothetical protein